MSTCCKLLILAAFTAFVGVNASAQTGVTPAKLPEDFKVFFGYMGLSLEIFRIDLDGTVYVTAYYGLPPVARRVDLSKVQKCNNCKESPGTGANKAAMGAKKIRLKKRLSASQVNTIFSELNKDDFLNVGNESVEGCKQTQTFSESTTYTMSVRSNGNQLSGMMYKYCDPLPGSKAARFSQIYEMLRGMVGNIRAVPVKSVEELYR